MILPLFLWTKDLMNSLYQCIQDAASFLRRAIGSQPEAAIILGTGLGGITNHISVTDRIPYNEIPHFPESTVQGHKGDLVFGTMAGRSVVVMQGRFHYYEGHTLQEATLPVRIMRQLGARFLFVNSAAGGLNPHFKPGDVMIVTDHINLLGDNPLRGVTDERLGDRFPDMSRPYDEELIEKAEKAALENNVPVKLGVYTAVAGPNLETRAETRMLRMLGADAVGMSTVPEVIVAYQVGFKTLALAAITNVNLPDAMEPVSIEKVIATASAAQPRLAAILEGTLQGMSLD
jgi:purine-nucleoside phosphorylase